MLSCHGRQIYVYKEMIFAKIKTRLAAWLCCSILKSWFLLVIVHRSSYKIMRGVRVLRIKKMNVNRNAKQ